ncbi:MAG: hypothetical protein HY390_05900, partial [Deltaproteobacteria bacterium]|nr:hypothetical protein [Deltaproteobacteria bacterium]
LLAFISKNVQARILDHRCEIFFVTQKLHIQGKKEDRVSIFPLSLQGAVVTTRNLSYPLIHERLHFGSNGMNNQMVQNTCSIQIHRGSVWAFHFFGS